MNVFVVFLLCAPFCARALYASRFASFAERMSDDFAEEAAVVPEVFGKVRDAEVLVKHGEWMTKHPGAADRERFNHQLE